MSDAEKLRRVIDASGMSARKYATEILLRDERTVRRWLAGDAIPDVVMARIDAEWRHLPPDQRLG